MEQPHLNSTLSNLWFPMAMSKIIVTENLRKFHLQLPKVPPTLSNFSILRLTKLDQNMKWLRTIRAVPLSCLQLRNKSRITILRLLSRSVAILTLVRSILSKMKDHTEIRMHMITHHSNSNRCMGIMVKRLRRTITIINSQMMMTELVMQSTIRRMIRISMVMRKNL